MFTHSHFLKTTLCILLLVFSLSVKCQYPDWNYFPRGHEIYSVAEDENYIWFTDYTGATGVHKISGHKKFINSTNSPIQENRTLKILVDSEGVKWLFTADNKLYRNDGENWTVFDENNSPLSGELFGTILMTIGPRNELWILDDGLHRYSGDRWHTYYDMKGFYHRNDNAIFIASVGDDIWLYNKADFVRFDGEEWHVQYSGLRRVPQDIAVDSKGIFWMVTDEIIARFDGKEDYEELFYVNEDYLTIALKSIEVDDGDNVWVDYEGGNVDGLLNYNGVHWIRSDTANSNLLTNRSQALYADNDNNLWVFGFTGKDKSLEKRHDGVSWQFYPYGAKMSSRTVGKISFDRENNAYLINDKATSFHREYVGATKFDGYDSWQKIDSFGSGIWSSFVTPNGDFYMRTNDHIKKFDGVNWWHTPVDKIYVEGLNEMVCYGENKIWIDVFTRAIGSNGNYFFCEGVAFFDGNKWTHYSEENSPLPAQDNVFQLSLDENNHIWIGTLRHGIFKFDGINWTKYEVPISYIKSFVIDDHKHLWVVGSNYVVYEYNGSQWIEHHIPGYERKDLSFGKLKVDKDGSIWLASVGDMMHFDGYNWEVFNRSNAPIGYINSFSIDNYGNKWIGTYYGFYIYKKGGVVYPNNKRGDEVKTMVYPNPSKTYFFVEFDREQQDVKMVLFDLMGKPVQTTKHEEIRAFKFEHGNLISGLYPYRITSGNKVISSGKIIVE